MDSVERLNAFPIIADCGAFFIILLAADLVREACRPPGTKKVIMAVGHSILVVISHMLDRRTLYQNLGFLYFEERKQRAAERRLTQRLYQLGYTATLEPAPA